MSKFDLEAAYKQVPARLQELRLQGFCWLGKFFVELDQIFGSISAVSNFDQLGHTKVDLAVVYSEVRKELVHRHLDDVPMVSPEMSGECARFTEVYKLICEKLNLRLAPDCPNKVKAFSDSKEGKVLGIWFDTELLSWSLHEEKKAKILQDIGSTLGSGLLEVNEMQKLMGRLGNFGLMRPFLRGFKGCLLEDLQYSLTRDFALVRLSEQSKKDLLVWARAVSKPLGALIIPRQPVEYPVLFHKVFTSDAAGCADSALLYQGPGGASVGIDEEGEICFAARVQWDRVMIIQGVDKEGKKMGCKTTFLELVAVLLPFLLIPGLLSSQHIVLETDNISCVLG